MQYVILGAGAAGIMAAKTIERQMHKVKLQ